MIGPSSVSQIFLIGVSSLVVTTSISICKKEKIKDETSKKIHETNGGQIKEQGPIDLRFPASMVSIICPPPPGRNRVNVSVNLSKAAALPALPLITPLNLHIMYAYLTFTMFPIFRTMLCQPCLTSDTMKTFLM